MKKELKSQCLPIALVINRSHFPIQLVAVLQDPYRVSQILVEDVEDVADAACLLLAPVANQDLPLAWIDRCCA